MVQVFHLNRHLYRYKSTCVVIIVAFFTLISFFEISYHFLKPCAEEEPIDVVYTWVNGSDPKFQKELKLFLKKLGGVKVDSTAQRFDDKNELKFSLRSLEKYAPWVRHVYIVTNGQIPHWLNLDYEKVSLITHEEIFTDSYNLPTFSSPAIEAQLHKIPGLSKRFIYFNDDIFLRSPTYKEDFYSSSQGFLIYLDWLLPMCSPECLWLYVGDGHCDNICNNPKCQMDGGDCEETAKSIIGDVIFTLNDLNTSIIHNLHNENNVSELIEKHNKKVILLDKIKRRKASKQIRKKSYRIDAYAESLQHTNRMLNEHYGFSVRMVPAHAPIMIDRDIMETMVAKFKKYFDKTVGNRMRSANDVQFAFAYYYFLIHEKNESSVGDIFDEFDTDKSGVWSDTEVRTVITKLYNLPITDQILSDFSSLFVNCSGHSITKQFLIGCSPLASFLKSTLGVKRKYKYRMIKDSEKKHVSFKMLKSNVTEVLQQFDDIRKNEKKFVCLNDNLMQSFKKQNEAVKSLMMEFYLSLFPNPSKFELPENYRNKFLYTSEYIIMTKNQNTKFLILCLFLNLIIFVVFLRKKVCKWIDMCFC